MIDHTYTEPVSKLLALGRPDNQGWHDYLKMGITRADIPELICLVEDKDLRWMEKPDGISEDKDLTEWYGQIHAWRALAQLKADEAIPALLSFLQDIDEYGDDWWYQINVLSIEEKTPKGRYPKITDRVGQSPSQYMEMEE